MAKHADKYALLRSVYHPGAGVHDGQRHLLEVVGLGARAVLGGFAVAGCLLYGGYCVVALGVSDNRGKAQWVASDFLSQAQRKIPFFPVSPNISAPN